MQFESLAKAQAVFGSKAYTDAKAIGDKYAKFRIAVEVSAVGTFRVSLRDAAALSRH